MLNGIIQKLKIYKCSGNKLDISQIVCFPAEGIKIAAKIEYTQ